MQGSGKVGNARSGRCVEWGRKARKAEARTKRRSTKVAAIRDAKD